MPLTPDDLKQVEDQLKEHYFLIRRETLVAVLAVAGFTGIAAVWAAAKAAVETGAAAEATGELNAAKKKVDEELMPAIETSRTRAEAMSQARLHQFGKPLAEPYQKPRKGDDNPEYNKVEFSGLSVSIKTSRHRPVVVALLSPTRPNGGGVGLDGRGKKTVAASVHIMRRKLDEIEKHEVGGATFVSDTSYLMVPASALQTIDEDPPGGECEYTIDVKSLKAEYFTGNGKFYFSPGVRLVAWEL